MAKEASKAMVPLYVRLHPEDRTRLDELVDSFPRVARKKVRPDASDPYKIPDAEAVRIAIKDSHEKRVKRRKK